MNLRFGTFAIVGLAAVAVAACSTSGSNGTSGNPLSGVTVIAYTPPPATPTPTPSPTPAPQTTQAIADGGFESGKFGNGWTACSIPHVAPSASSANASPVPTADIGAVIVSATSSPFAVIASASPQPPEVDSGTYAALTYSGTGAESTFLSATNTDTGPAGLNGVCQTFSVPADGVLTFNVYEGGSDTGLDYADQEADLLTASGTETNLFYELNDPNYTSTNGSVPFDAWVSKGPYNLTAAPYNFTPGESLTLFIGSFDSEPDAKYGVFMFVDNVSVTGTNSASALRRRATHAAPNPRR